MPFPSNLQGLNLLSPAYVEPSITDEELASTLALWTNVDFSYDDGGIGLESAQKLLEEDASAAVEQERAQRSMRNLEGQLARRDHGEFAPSALPHFGEHHHNQVQEQDHSSSSAFFGSEFALLAGGGGAQQVGLVDGPVPAVEQQDELDPFGLDSTLFALHQQATANAALAASPTSVLGRKRELEEDQPTVKASSNKRKNVARSESVLSSVSTPAVKNENDEQPLAPEDDKRKRNTAASARFRQKKKEREQALEKTSKELQNRCALLEREVETLRRENGWLKTLVLGNGQLPAL